MGFYVSIATFVVSFVALVIAIRSSLKIYEFTQRVDYIVEKNWLGNLGLNDEVKETIKRNMSEHLNKSVTDDVIDKVAKGALEDLTFSVSMGAKEMIVSRIEEDITKAVLEKRTAEVMALVDVKAIANSMTMLAASEIMQRIPKNTRETY